MRMEGKVPLSSPDRHRATGGGLESYLSTFSTSETHMHSPREPNMAIRWNVPIMDNYHTSQCKPPRTATTHIKL